MANEKRLIDANALIAEYDRVHIGGPGKARKLIVDAPTVDAVPVVRCENCRKRNTWECAMHYESEDGKEQYGWEDDNDFCSWGERKVGDGNG